MKALPQAIAGASFHKGIIAGKIERGDAGDDAERLAHRIEVDAGAGAVGIFALHQMRDAEREFDHLDAALDVALGVGDRLAVLARENVGKLVIILGDEVEEFHQDAGAALRVDRGPAQLRGFRVLDRSADFGPGGQSHMGAHRAVHRLEDVGGPPDLPATCLPPMKCPYSIMVPLPRWSALGGLCAHDFAHSNLGERASAVQMC